MPRNRSRNKNTVNGAKPEMIEGRQVFTQSGLTTTSYSISPATFTRALAIADVFQFYRCTKLRVIALPQDSNIIFGYAPGAAFDTPPASGSDVIQLPFAKYHASGKFMETILDIPRKELLGDAQIPWFKTIIGTPATQFEIQGNLYVSSGATGIAFVIEYAFEFQSWNLATQSPLSKVSLKVTKDQSECTHNDNPSTIVVQGKTYRLSEA